MRLSKSLNRYTPGVCGGLCNPSYWYVGIWRKTWGWEYSLKATDALVAAAPILGSISNPPPGDASWFCVGCGCHKDPISAQIAILPCSTHGITALMWCYDRTGCRIPPLPGLIFVQVPPYALWGYLKYLQRKKGCYKQTKLLGSRPRLRSKVQSNKTKQGVLEEIYSPGTWIGYDERVWYSIKATLIWILQPKGFE